MPRGADHGRRAPPEFQPRRCRVCKTMFPPVDARGALCADCRKARANAARPALDCRECGKPFVPRFGPQKYCAPCIARRKGAGAYALAKRRALAAEAEPEAPAKPGARPGDFQPPTGKCARCTAVVILSRTDEYTTQRPDPKAQPILLCRRCSSELCAPQPAARASMSAEGFDARESAIARCTSILLGLGREDRAAAWKALDRAREQTR